LELNKELINQVNIQVEKLINGENTYTMKSNLIMKRFKKVGDD